MLDGSGLELSVACFNASCESTIASGSTFLGGCEVWPKTVNPPLGDCFAGAMYGIYSFGKGEPVLDPADFGGRRGLRELEQRSAHNSLRWSRIQST